MIEKHWPNAHERTGSEVMNWKINIPSKEEYCFSSSGLSNVKMQRAPPPLLQVHFSCLDGKERMKSF